MDLEPDSWIGKGPVMPAGSAIFVTVVALFIGLLLNAPDILETARRQEAGWKREVAVAAAKPFDSIAQLLLLDTPHDAIDLALGRQGAPPTTTTSPVAAMPVSTTAPVLTTTTTEARRVVSATDPLRLFIGGDSMVGQFGPMLSNEAEKTGYIDVTEIVYEFDSGLTRTDFLDWPARLREISAEQDPDAIVLFFGGNDAQAIQIEGTWYDYGTEEWLAEYRRRVGDLMNELTADNRDVYWVGMPIVRSDSFREKVATMNGIYESEAAAHPGVNYINSWDVFVGPDGGFSEYLTNEEGDLVDMRLNDGIHLTTAGGIRLARVALAEIVENWQLS
ncbi:MAG: SGNH/GDSL hydrolase family protein [Acidimicrobiia bacterium]